jgi:hypothetical protein
MTVDRGQIPEDRNRDQITDAREQRPENREQRMEIRDHRKETRKILCWSNGRSFLTQTWSGSLETIYVF